GRASTLSRCLLDARLRGHDKQEEFAVPKLRLTVACGDYEIVRALKDGAVQADGIELVMLTGMGSKERHWRMARKTEFDVCEVNIGGYYMGRDRGEALTAMP